MGRPVAPLTVAQLQSESRPAGLLFVQEPLAPELQNLATCQVGEINPYLKPDRAALLVRMGGRLPLIGFPAEHTRQHITRPDQAGLTILPSCARQ